MKEKFDLFIADGASHAQTTGVIINAHFPWITTVHGSEHGISLVFSDTAKKTETKVSFSSFLTDLIFSPKYQTPMS